MSCIACEDYAKRITNLYRDAELKDKYEYVIGVKIFIDCFICDGCNEKISEMSKFKDKCIDIFNRMYNINPIISTTSEDQQLEPIDEMEEQHNIEDAKKEGFLINQQIYEESESNFKDETEYEITEIVEECELDKSQDVSNNDEDIEYEEIYLEFDDDDESKLIEEQNIPVRNPSGKKTTRKSYTVEEKLQIIGFAEGHKNRLAARKFGLNESTIRCFRKQKEQLLKMNPEKKTNRKGYPHWPELESELKQFVLEVSKSTGAGVKMKDIRSKAINLAEKHQIPNFNGSNSFIFKFMQRNALPIASPRPRKKVDRSESKF